MNHRIVKYKLSNGNICYFKNTNTWYHTFVQSITTAIQRLLNAVRLVFFCHSKRTAQSYCFAIGLDKMATIKLVEESIIKPNTQVLLLARTNMNKKPNACYLLWQWNKKITKQICLSGRIRINVHFLRYDKILQYSTAHIFVLIAYIICFRAGGQIPTELENRLGPKLTTKWPRSDVLWQQWMQLLCFICFYCAANDGK